MPANAGRFWDVARTTLALSVLGVVACAPHTAASRADDARVPAAAEVRPVGRAPLRSSLSAADQRWVDETVARLPLRRKVAQLMMPRIGGTYMPLDSYEYDRLSRCVEELGVGGVIVSGGPALGIATKLNALQRIADVPLLVTADLEHGAGQILYTSSIGSGAENGGTRFPPLMGLGATGNEQYAYELGRVTALEARAVGIHVVFAPVSDVNNNPDNPIINTRSYGADPALVSRFVAAHVRGLQEHGAIATPKHFPGHGDTGTDSHIELPFIYVDRARVDAIELVPFRAALAAGAAAVMTAHIAFPALSGDSVPTTLNDRIIRPLLREQLRFDDLVFTDAMDMGAITRIYGNGVAHVMALRAGADVWLQPLPQAIELVIDTVTRAVERGDIPEARIDESLRRVLTAKAKLGLHRNRYVAIERIPDVLGARRHTAVAAEAAQRSITAVRNRGGVLPLATQRVLSIVYTDDADPQVGRAFQRELAARLPAVRTVLLTGAADTAQLNAVRRIAENVDVVLFSPFIRVSAGKTDLAVAHAVAQLVTELQSQRPVVVTAFGNPYVLRQFPTIDHYVLAWGQWEPLQTAAARALTGVAPITGRLPMSIPPYHNIGDGVTIEARSRT